MRVCKFANIIVLIIKVLDKAAAGPFAANIGPTSRLEFGYFVQECLRNPAKRRFIVGSPADAEGIKWAKKIADTLVANTWNY